jgi:hypothetical protein
LLLPPSAAPSFPSDHATFAFAIAVANSRASRAAGLLASSIVAAIAISRVYAGEHYGRCDRRHTARRDRERSFLACLPRLEPIVTPLLRVARRMGLA